MNDLDITDTSHTLTEDDSGILIKATQASEDGDALVELVVHNLSPLLAMELLRHAGEAIIAEATK